jgi:hypothetical protein
VGLPRGDEPDDSYGEEKRGGTYEEGCDEEDAKDDEASRVHSC